MGMPLSAEPQKWLYALAIVLEVEHIFLSRIEDDHWHTGVRDHIPSHVAGVLVSHLVRAAPQADVITASRVTELHVGIMQVCQGNYVRRVMVDSHPPLVVALV